MDTNNNNPPDTPAGQQPSRKRTPSTSRPSSPIPLASSEEIKETEHHHNAKRRKLESSDSDGPSGQHDQDAFEVAESLLDINQHGGDNDEAKTKDNVILEEVKEEEPIDEIKEEDLDGAVKEEKPDMKTLSSQAAVALEKDLSVADATRSQDGILQQSVVEQGSQENTLSQRSRNDDRKQDGDDELENLAKDEHDLAKMEGQEGSKLGGSGSDQGEKRGDVLDDDKDNQAVEMEGDTAPKTSQEALQLSSEKGSRDNKANNDDTEPKLEEDEVSASEQTAPAADHEARGADQDTSEQDNKEFINGVAMLDIGQDAEDGPADSEHAAGGSLGETIQVVQHATLVQPGDAPQDDNYAQIPVLEGQDSVMDGGEEPTVEKTAPESKVGEKKLLLLNMEYFREGLARKTPKEPPSSENADRNAHYGGVEMGDVTTSAQQPPIERVSEGEPQQDESEDDIGAIATQGNIEKRAVWIPQETASEESPRKSMRVQKAMASTEDKSAGDDKAQKFKENECRSRSQTKTSTRKNGVTETRNDTQTTTKTEARVESAFVKSEQDGDMDGFAKPEPEDSTTLVFAEIQSAKLQESFNSEQSMTSAQDKENHEERRDSAYSKNNDRDYTYPDDDFYDRMKKIRDDSDDLVQHISGLYGAYETDKGHQRSVPEEYATGPVDDGDIAMPDAPEDDASLFPPAERDAQDKSRQKMLELVDELRFILDQLVQDHNGRLHPHVVTVLRGYVQEENNFSPADSNYEIDNTTAVEGFEMTDRLHPKQSRRPAAKPPLAVSTDVSSSSSSPAHVADVTTATTPARKSTSLKTPSKNNNKNKASMNHTPGESSPSSLSASSSSTITKASSGTTNSLPFPSPLDQQQQTQSRQQSRSRAKAQEQQQDWHEFYKRDRQHSKLPEPFLEDPHIRLVKPRTRNIDNRAAAGDGGSDKNKHQSQSAQTQGAARGQQQQTKENDGYIMIDTDDEGEDDAGRTSSASKAKKTAAASSSFEYTDASSSSRSSSSSKSNNTGGAGKGSARQTKQAKGKQQTPADTRESEEEARLMRYQLGDNAAARPKGGKLSRTTSINGAGAVQQPKDELGLGINLERYLRDANIVHYTSASKKISNLLDNEGWACTQISNEEDSFRKFIERSIKVDGHVVMAGFPLVEDVAFVIPDNAAQPDGDCYWRALSMCLHGTSSHWGIVKADHLCYIHHVLENPDHPRYKLYHDNLTSKLFRSSGPIDEGTFKANLVQLLHMPHAWTPAAIQQITADLYHVMLVTFTVKTDSGVLTEVNTRGAYNSRHIFMMFSDDCHFNPMFPNEFMPWEFRYPRPTVENTAKFAFAPKQQARKKAWQHPWRIEFTKEVLPPVPRLHGYPVHKIQEYLKSSVGK